MTRRDLPRLRVIEPPMERCWSRIGVSGDRTCKELATVHHCHHCGVFTDAARLLLDRPIPDGAETTFATAATPASETGGSAARSVVVFDLGDERLAIDSAHVVKAVEPRPVSRVPKRSNAVFEGIVNIDGQLELCVSLHALLGVSGRSRATEAARRMLVLHANGPKWVTGVDAIVDVRRVGDSAFGAPPSTVSRDGPRLVDRVIRDGGEAIGHLDGHAVAGALDRYVR